MQDPVRFILPPGGGATVETDMGIAGVSPAEIVFSIGNGGLFIISQINNGVTTNYTQTIGAWWGRISTTGYSTAGSLSQGFPGHFYEVQLSISSGAVSGSPPDLNTWLRLNNNTSREFSFSRTLGVGTDLAIILVEFRRFGTTPVLASTTINIGLQNT